MQRIIPVLLGITVLILFPLNCKSQANMGGIFVKHVVIDAAYDPRFIWSIANSAIPWDKKTTQGDIRCATAELRKTGLFKEVVTSLKKVQDPDALELIFRLTYRDRDLKYRIDRISVEKMEGVNLTKLRLLMKEQKIVGTEISLKTENYNVFEDRLLEIVKQSIEANDERKVFANPLFLLSLNANKRLSIRIAAQYSGCLANH
jgi:hypothetical protein